MAIELWFHHEASAFVRKPLLVVHLQHTAPSTPIGPPESATRDPIGASPGTSAARAFRYHKV